MTDEELYQFLFSLFMDGHLVSGDELDTDWTGSTPDEVYYKFISICKLVDSNQFDEQFEKARDDYNNIPLIKALG